MSPLSRRQLLVGGASALVLAACGGGDDDGGGATAADADGGASWTPPAGGIALYRVFSPTQPVGDGTRLPIALAEADGALLDAVPGSITYRYGMDGQALGEPIDAPRHDAGIPTPYFPLHLDLAEPGTWRIEIDAGGAAATTTLEAVPPGQTAVVPGPGAELIPLRTPTPDEPRGVDPICTRDPMCPFHSQTLEAAMGSGTAVAFLISTPLFCQTAICGPVLDLLIEREEEYRGRLTIVHAEVYTDDTARTTTDAVQAYGLTWEPSLFLARADGTIASRLDYTYDAVEVDDALSELLG